MALTDSTDCTELPLAPLALLRGFRAIAKAHACLYTRLKHGWPGLQGSARCQSYASAGVLFAPNSSIPQIRRV